MRKLFLALIVAAWWSTPALADYYDPPEGWPDNDYFTHQQWEFSTGDNPTPADSYINNNGLPWATITGDTIWIDDPSAYVETDRRGMWVVGGFEEATSATLELAIPNVPALAEKLVWLQLTYYLVGAPGAGYVTDLFTEGGELITVLPDSEVAYAVDPVNEPGWFYYEKMWSIQPQPGSETIQATIDLPPMAAFALDEAAVDTICIPEPATLSLFILGCLAAVRPRRR